LRNELGCRRDVRVEHGGPDGDDVDRESDGRAEDDDNCNFSVDIGARWVDLDFGGERGGNFDYFWAGGAL
jgi:hypothetical protein